MPDKIKEENRTFSHGWVSDIARARDVDAFRLPEGWWEHPREIGSITNAPGRTSTATELLDISSLYRAESSSGDVLRMVQSDTEINILNANGTVNSTPLKTGLTASLRVSYCVMGDGTNEYIICFNGTDTPFKILIDSTPTSGDVSNIGLTRQSVTNATAATNAGGSNNVKGVVKYFLAELSSTTEAALSASFGEIDAGDGNRINVVLTHADFASKVFKIYRTYANFVDPFYVGQIDTSSSTTFTDDVSDANLGDPPFANGDVPPSGITSCVTYYNRVYGMDGNDLYWSDLGQPESYATWAGGNRLTVGHNDGDVGTAIARDSDGIIFFKKGHIYKVFGYGPRFDDVRELAPSDQPTRSIGTPGINSFTYTPAGIFFYFNGGFYMYNQNRVRRLSQLVEDDIDTIITTGDFDESGPWDISMGYQPSTGRVWATLRNATFFYDIQRDRFVGAMQHGFRCYMVDDFGNSESFFCGGSKGDVGSHDTKQIYTSDITTTLAQDQAVRLYPFGDSTVLRNFVYVELLFRNAGAARNIDLFVDVNGTRVQTYSAESVNDTTGRSRFPSRFYIDSIGYDCELTITSDSGQNSTNALTLYGVKMAYQDVSEGTGALMAS